MNPNIALLASLAAVNLAAAATPGPNFLLISQSAMRHGRRPALGAALGVATASIVWCIAVTTGLALLFQIVPWLSGLLRIGGGVYLIQLGIRLWRSASASSHSGTIDFHRAAFGASYAKGLLTNLLNPKSAVYFSSVFVLFIGPGSPGWLCVAAGAVVVASGFAWDGAVVLLCSTTRAVRLYRRAERGLTRAAGGAMALFGLGLLLKRD
ncbi:MAG TPA: LysE family transporter [Aliidongia sp.]|uniref:LysE family translocator n=1 Tax=Aliidongia sp. TaxID=1914230 RepID=UPI002DDD2466|nr:LysE family transporter [Aliidongia sp.]HEV2676761.1 LysE family transporter [Aliidongia sp.]